MQTEQLLFWNGMTDTEHSTTASSNEEVQFDMLLNRNTASMAKRLMHVQEFKSRTAKSYTVLQTVHHCISIYASSYIALVL